MTGIASGHLQGFVGGLEDQAVVDQAGYRENAVNLARGPVDGDPFALGRHLVIDMDDDRDCGRVDELTALKPDQDLVVLGRGSFERVFQLVGDRQVDLALHLDLVAARLDGSLSQLEGSHLEPPL